MGYHREHSVPSALFQLQATGSVAKLLHMDIKAEHVLVTQPLGGPAYHLGPVLADWGCDARGGEALLATTPALLPDHPPKGAASEDIKWHMFCKLLDGLAKVLGRPESQRLGKHLFFLAAKRGLAAKRLAGTCLALGVRARSVGTFFSNPDAAQSEIRFIVARYLECAQTRHFGERFRTAVLR